MPLYPVTRDSDVPTADQLKEVLGGSAVNPLPKAADRAAWAEVASRPWLADRVSDVLERATDVAEKGPGLVKATDYLDFFRTGSRDAHRASASPRGGRLGLLLLAECLEGKGRFLDAMLDLSWAMAEETSWVMPPHLQHAVDDVLPDVAQPDIDLRTACVAAALAEMMHVLDAQMDQVGPNWRKRLQFELRRQVVGPYLERDFHWQDATHNWNAVCTSGVVTAALLGDFDLDTRARALAKGLRSVSPFLSGFTADGGCSEGPGYWCYGMSHYSRMAYHVHCATGGEVDLLADPVLPAVYGYPAKTVLDGQKVVNFADSPWTVNFRSGPVAWVAGKLEVPETRALACRADGAGTYPTDVLDAYLTPELLEFRPPRRSVMPELEVVVVRAGDELVLAVKGGHNREHHNHNDVGNFIICLHEESLVCDLGKGAYVKEFFGPKRYEFLTTRSLGHNVPVLNGTEQGTGEEFGADDFHVETSEEAVRVEMHLARAYPEEANVARLRRTVTLHLGGDPHVELVDKVSFRDGAGVYELPLYTEGRFEIVGPGTAIARGDEAALSVAVDGDGVALDVEEVEHDDAALEKHFGPTLSRLRVRVEPNADGATVRIAFSPRT